MGTVFKCLSNFFDKKYNLVDILPFGIDFFEKEKKHKWQITYAKLCILNSIARYYLKPYWINIRRIKNENVIKKYKAKSDPYFLACYSLLESELLIKKKYIEAPVHLNKNVKKIKEEDLIKFLILDRGESFAIWGTILILIAFVSYKFIIPGLKNYYWSLMWGY